MELRAWLAKLPTYNTSTQKSTNSEWEKLDTDESMRNMRKKSYLYKRLMVDCKSGIFVRRSLKKKGKEHDAHFNVWQFFLWRNVCFKSKTCVKEAKNVCNTLQKDFLWF